MGYTPLAVTMLLAIRDQPSGLIRAPEVLVV
jgi:hypothetical protein